MGADALHFASVDGQKAADQYFSFSSRCAGLLCLGGSHGEGGLEGNLWHSWAVCSLVQLPCLPATTAPNWEGPRSCEHIVSLLQHPNAVAVEVKAYLYRPGDTDGRNNFYRGEWLFLPSF